MSSLVLSQHQDLSSTSQEGSLLTEERTSTTSNTDKPLGMGQIPERLPGCKERS